MRISTLYKAPKITAASITKSDIKLKVSEVDSSPFVMMESTPTPAIKIPILCFQLINSLNNNHDNSTVNAEAETTIYCRGIKI